MLTEGADMLDIGAYSSRPGADDVSSDMELERLSLGMDALTEAAGRDIPVSVDTFRADVAKETVTNLSCDIINDISGGSLDPQMWSTVAELGVPYILMHMRGTPATMQSMTDYSAWNGDVTSGVIAELSHKVTALRHMGVADIIIDPGFGFSKTVEQNYRLINSMEHIADLFHAPLLVGISRKSMIYKPLGITPAEALNGTTALHVIALMHGAAILRVHDVKAAREALTVFELAEQNL
jgi:dihydropteroate synthase